jgi:RimJ/RimL family protein N-acetyltransferase
MAEFRLETERLVLRQWREADREPHWAMACDAEVMRYLPPQTQAESSAGVDRMMAMQAEHGHCLWALERKDEGRFIGFCGLAPPRDPLTEVEIGWRLERAAWGQGFAREAAEASLVWGWRNLATATIVAITTVANTRSWGLMERLGMTRYPDEDFDHPALAEDDPLRPHVLYRIHRPQ